MRKDQKIYAKEDDVYFRKQSDALDSAEKMKAGEELVIVDGPWWRVTKKGVQGWVRADYLSETDPNPTPIKQTLVFTKGIPHSANHPNTIEVRKTIKDVLNGGKSGYALQCTEYVVFMVKTKLGIDIEWPVSSGRDGGKWADIFERYKKYAVLSEPRVNCAACFTEVRRKDGTLTKEGHIAFIEEVKPGGLIKVSEANWPGDGIYSEREIARERWQNHYKAKFVSFI